MATGCTSLGAIPHGTHLERIQESSQWRDGAFRNGLPKIDPKVSEFLPKWLEGGSKHRSPDGELPIRRRLRTDFDEAPASGLRVTWLGHSTLLVEIDGARILVDPVWGERTSPFPWVGPKRFHEPPLPLSELPPIDAIVISHDHYDHLDHFTVDAMLKADVPWLVPLGVGSHLAKWGVPETRIFERDWWEEAMVKGVRLIAVPARHFSGRSVIMLDQDKTLWAGWVLRGPEHRVYYSGDTGMFPGFREIGERHGPFDITMIETGAYNQMWGDVHLGPEQAVQAHVMAQGQLYMPVHWGTFDLALHGWTEPVERVLAAAEGKGVRVVVPRPGQSVEPDRPPELVRWWPELPWQTAEEAPVVSSHLGPEFALGTAPLHPGHP